MPSSQENDLGKINGSKPFVKTYQSEPSRSKTMKYYILDNLGIMRMCMIGVDCP